MAKEASFDVVSEVDLQEVQNAVQQALKEISTRFDFKGSKSDIEFDGKGVITLLSDDEYKLNALRDVLESKLVKRGVSLKALRPGKIEPAAGGTVRQAVRLQQGIEQDVAKQITKLVKDTKLKVQVSIQGDQLRVSGKSRDDLQAVIRTLREADLPVPLQFTNYRG
ncbi:YajQ family cyclic di-GMP-binding protein [Alicyclobacillus macrosporangiidus]|uniref:YajQ family cyclic di-GMP-binding protein n=1 Tax=Alicyclobacillus macrosporangiidus TaxID=392015 RepID=UPI00049606B0|nr:YajQ family cyclic di-GMP-binding protein [Alicyclobacillus macrosporangiidus]MCL6597304.1 YajQ family cyclic di-GMP-binding protein [Alicyclobacillus macrosporangiidus]